MDSQSANMKVRVIAHEIGHAFGLADTTGQVLMNANSSTSIISPTTNDINAAKAQATTLP
jgi:predicted Zn-dependent protease